MASSVIVEDLDVVEDVGAHQAAGLVDAVADTLLLWAAEEVFGGRVVPTTVSPTHAGDKLVCTAEPLPIIVA